jgi:hypothetical protein
LFEFLKRFWTAAVSLAAVAGLYFAAAAKHVLLAFFVVVGVAVLAAGGSIFIHRYREIMKRLRTYPKLLARAGELEAEVESLKMQLKEQREAATLQISEAISEGRQQATGVVMSLMAPIPILTGVESRNGKLVLIAEPDGKPPPLGARYFVESKLTGEIKGAVEVEAYDPARKFLFLGCIEFRVARFWDTLAEASTLDPSPPTGVTLSRYKVPDNTKPSNFQLPG